MALRHLFVSLDRDTGSIQAPGPNLRPFEGPLAARRAWRVGVMNVWEAHVTE